MSSSEWAEFRQLKLKFSSQQTCFHQILFKPHNIRVEEESKPRDRTLFLANIPPWATPQVIKKIFRVNGNISNVFFQLQPSVGAPDPRPEPNSTFSTDRFTDPYSMESGFKFAYVVFEKSVGVKTAMTKMDLSKEYIASTDSFPIVTGVVRWNTRYNSVLKKENKLKEEIDAFMKKYDEEENLRKKREAEDKEPDDDGWTTVGPKKERKVQSKDEQQTTGRKTNMKGRRQKKKLELKNFYSHQIREEKISKVQELRAKFEKDKEKIAKMKSERKFRPF